LKVSSAKTSSREVTAHTNKTFNLKTSLKTLGAFITRETTSSRTLCATCKNKKSRGREDRRGRTLSRDSRLSRSRRSTADKMTREN
jgi:hypothetical protein